MQHDLSSGSSCSSERVAPHAHNNLHPPSEKERPASVQSSSRPQTKAQHKTVLDDATKTRLIQLYTTCKPVTCPKKIQSQFTCLYLTKSNINEVLGSLSKSQPASQRQSPCTSPKSLSYSHFADLSKLTEQSWRVTAGTLDYLELIWTGQEQDRSWADTLVSQAGKEESATASTVSPSAADEDDCLALNMAVTYYYTLDGQPTLSLSAIAMTKEAFNTINSHMRSKSHLDSRNQLAGFDKIPFVHRALLVPTLCRWRNADVQSSLTMAAEGRAWATKLLSEDWGEEMVLDVPGAWFFPTAKIINETLDEELPTAEFSSSTEDTADDDDNDEEEETDSNDAPTSGSPSTLDMQTLDGHSITSQAPFMSELPDLQSSPGEPRGRRREPSPSHELRAALIPGRDAVFRTIASRLSVLLDRKWIRRSTQFPVTHSALVLRTKSMNSGTKRRRGA